MSACGKYRYRLSRVWGASNGDCAVFIMLNPSTADATEDDPTIRRCIGFAQSWGAERLEVVNLFAWRATDPRELKKAGAVHAIGPENDAHIKAAVRRGNWNVCAWGAGGSLWKRDEAVMRLLLDATSGSENLGYLRLTSKMQPCHPLYLPGTLYPTWYKRTTP